ncbi:hypothetical protein GIB67_005818 [Kingdonia uniflora]|uniref:Uncharacterized protein n=1 Tax=Kingdonia uniflora TaxID=39325 RepID=A0A7J7LUH4_9MAGN|nr:hypothetical protein GIB67_005818 [Kingdonia uniflora]
MCQSWHCLAKTAAKSKALECAKETMKERLDDVTVSPCLVNKPMLQSTMNATNLYHGFDRFSEVEDKEKLSSEKLQNLGWSYRPLEQTLIDSV